MLDLQFLQIGPHQFATKGGRRRLLEREESIDPFALQQLDLAICDALVEADRLELSMVGIYLSHALEILRREHPFPIMPSDTASTN